MILSMTGYYSTTFELPTNTDEKVYLSLELKSFNTRYFEASCRIPGSLGHLEHKMLSMLKKELKRGRVYLNIRTTGESASFEKVVPCLDVAQGYVDGAKMLESECDLEGHLTIADLVPLTNVFMFEKATLTPEQEEAFLNEIASAIVHLNDTRKQEGESIERDIKTIFDRCQHNIDIISHRHATVLQEKKDQVSKLSAESEKGDAQAAATLEDAYKSLDKIDIHEELARFKSHLQSINKLLGAQTIEKGRRLDFVLQELMREVNTTTAKCSDYEISSHAVEIKVDLEKIREQVQNAV